MLVFRSLTLGLLGACLFLLAGVHSPPESVEVLETHAIVSIAPRPLETNQVTVIDVAPHLSATTIASLVRLGAGERIVTVGDRHVGSDLEAGMEVADVLRGGSNLLDLTVSGEGVGVRRVLVVRH